MIAEPTRLASHCHAGYLAALGSLVYSPLTLTLGEWFALDSRICNRAVAFGI